MTTDYVVQEIEKNRDGVSFVPPNNDEPKVKDRGQTRTPQIPDLYPFSISCRKS